MKRRLRLASVVAAALAMALVTWANVFDFGIYLHRGSAGWAMASAAYAAVAGILARDLARWAWRHRGDWNRVL
jgi:hypothetical protein